MMILGILLACAVLAPLWRRFDDWRDRRAMRRARARMRHVITALHAVALEENAAFDELAARRTAEAEKQRAHVDRFIPRVDRNSKRAA